MGKIIMFSSPIDEIKSRLDIVEVIGGYIKLSKAGVNYRAVCPFHSEKKPSFFVSPARQIWHCFGCSLGGDIFKFVMQIEGIEFGDALRILAQKAGVELKEQSPKLKTERQRLYEICELSCRFFEKQLSASALGEAVKQYLLSRGINEESIKAWRLGWAPDSWQGLSDFLVGRGYSREEVEKAGLAIKREGKFYDRFRGRIMFPIFDLNSQVIGFGGRVFQNSEEIAKYVNTPATLLYDKGKILYGLDKAKVEIRKRDSVMLVEGYIDAIMVSQAGFKNVVAVSGTALTPYQLRLLKRYTGNLLVAFDMDVAGSAATKRGIDLAQNEDFNIKVVTMPRDKDPADVIARSPKEWEELVSNSRSIMDFYFENAFSIFDKSSPEGKKKIAQLLLPAIKRIPNSIERSYWIQKLASDLEAREDDVRDQLNKINDDRPYQQESPPPTMSIEGGKPKSRKELMEERIITLVMKYPSYLPTVLTNDLSSFNPETRKILRFLSDNSEDPPQDIKDRLDYLYLRADLEEWGEDFRPENEIKSCLKEIRSLKLKESLNSIANEIKEAESDNDSDKVKALLARFNELLFQLNNG